MDTETEPIPINWGDHSEREMRDQESTGIHSSVVSFYAPPDFIIDHLYLGNQDSAVVLEELEGLSVKSVLVVGRELSLHFPDQIRYLHILVDDIISANIQIHFEEAIDFIENSVEYGQMLVHCAEGVSRSASIVTAYLMKKHRYSLAEALIFLKEKRPKIRPNEGFLQQLSEYAQQLGLSGKIPKSFIRSKYSFEKRMEEKQKKKLLESQEESK